MSETKRPKLLLRRYGEGPFMRFALVNECGHEIPGLISVTDTGECNAYGTPIFLLHLAAEIEPEKDQ